MERNKGQDEPSPSLHGCPAVRPRPRLCEALWNDAPPKTGKKTSSGLPGYGLAVVEWDWSLSAFASLLCLQCTIIHATYTTDVPLTLCFLSTLNTFWLFARSRKLHGLWAKASWNWFEINLQSNGLKFPILPSWHFHSKLYFYNQMLFSSRTVCFDDLCIYLFIYLVRYFLFHFII